MKINLTEKEITAIENVINYLYEKEKEDYEQNKEEIKIEDHIIYALNTLCLLVARAKGTKSPDEGQVLRT